MSRLSISIEPLFTAAGSPDERPFDGWDITVEGLPGLDGPSEAAIKYAEDVRLDAIKTFIRTLMQEGGWWSRGWWTFDLARDIDRLRETMEAILPSAIAANMTSNDWLARARKGQRLDNPNILASIIKDVS